MKKLFLAIIALAITAGAWTYMTTPDAASKAPVSHAQRSCTAPGGYTQGCRYRDGSAKAKVVHRRVTLNGRRVIETVVDGQVADIEDVTSPKAQAHTYHRTSHTYRLSGDVIKVTSPKARTIRIDLNGSKVTSFTGVTSDPGVQVTCHNPAPYMTGVHYVPYGIDWTLHECGRTYRGGVAQ
jgi:hypothetical protein